MEEHVLPDELADVVVRASASKRSQLSRSALDLLVGDPRRRAPRRVALEQRAQLVEVVEVVGVVHADHRAAVRRRLDQALGLEHEQRLADRRAADPELARELLLLQALARLEPPVEDRLADQLGRGDARVPNECLAVFDHPGHGTNIQYAIRPAKAVRPPASFVGRTGRDARDYRSAVDRVAIARAERRRQVTEELEFERDRAAQLLEQLEGIILELEGAAVDEQVFAKMSPERRRAHPRGASGRPGGTTRGLRRGMARPGGRGRLDTELEEDVVDPEQWTIEQRQENEAEIVRLGEEIATSNRRQEALERYLDLLEDGDGASAAGRPTVAELEAAWAVPSPHRARAARSG